MTAIVSAGRRASHTAQRTDLREALVKLELAAESVKGRSTAAAHYVREAHAIVSNALRLLQTEPNAADGGDYRHERIRDPSRFDRRSFRTISQDGHRVIVGCPVGHWHPGGRAGAQCDVPVEIQAILHPKAERNCPNPLLAYVNPAIGRHGRQLGTALYEIVYQHVHDAASAPPRKHVFELPDHVGLWILSDYQVLIQGRRDPIIGHFRR